MQSLLILFILTTLAGLIGCDSQDKQRELERAELKLKTQQALVFRDLNERKHAAILKGMRIVEGDAATSHLELCYSDGYDSVQDDNHNFHTDLSQTLQLSRRRVAECDRIIQVYQKEAARTKSEEKAKDAAYDKAHPQR
jgi:uncharacterized small protein (DUF1192 family)